MKKLCVVLATAWISAIGAGDQVQTVELSGTWNLIGELPASSAPAGPGRALSLFIKQRANEIQVDRLVPSGKLTMYLTLTFKLDGTQSVNSWGREASDVAKTRASWDGARLSMASETSKTAWKEVFYRDREQLVSEETQADGKVTQLRYALVIKRRSP